MAVDIGRVNYMAYAKYVTENSKEKFTMAKWEDIGKLAQDSWRHGAVAVLKQIDWEKEQDAKGLY